MKLWLYQYRVAPVILLPVLSYADSVSVARVIAMTERGDGQADTGGHIIPTLRGS
jgi:hypothetical protein